MSAPIAATLVLSPDNPCNAAIVDELGQQLNTVHTEHDKATITHVKNAEDEVIASLEWRDVLSDKVTVGNKGPMSLRDWLHTSIVPFYRSDLLHLCSDVTFQDNSGRKYKWRGNAPGRAMELFSEDDGFKEPIARFLKSIRNRGRDLDRPATLLLTTRALEVRDTVVTSFLFLEKGRRTNETTSQNTADVLATPALSALTGSDYNVRNGGI
ncbi:hypothetical protein BV20DRAFT_947538 [Pilatotrama ljubarskyi]|nr:hypothetical protein BV20DRAFT_947538 [Pilatotrama ljubarskyi]